MIKGITVLKLMLVLFLIATLTGSFAGLRAQTPGTLYGSTGSAGATLVTIDTASGAGTLVGTIGTLGPVTEIEFRSDGVLFGATGAQSGNIITIDPLTGAETLVGMPAGGSVNGLEFDSNGDLYGSFFAPLAASSDLVIIDPSNGQFISTVGQMGVQVITGLAFHPNGTLYGVGHSAGGSASNLYTINTSTGASTLVGAVGFNGVGALEFGPDGVLYGGVGVVDPGAAGHLIIIDPTTGAGTDIGPTGSPGVSGLSFYPQPTSIRGRPNGNIPDQISLDQNYPNPFNPVTRISFGLPNSSDVKVEIFDVLGHKVMTLLDTQKPAGFHTVDFDAGNLASGVYFYRLQADGFVEMRKMMLMK